jgi:hypothetical protein
MFAGCTAAVTDALINTFKNAETCPVQSNGGTIVFIRPPGKIVPL